MALGMTVGLGAYFSIYKLKNTTKHRLPLPIESTELHSSSLPASTAFMY